MSTAATTAKHGAQRCPRAGLGARHLALHPPAEGTLCHHPLLLLPPSPPLLRAPGCLGPSSGDISEVGARIRCDPGTHGDPGMGVPVGCGCPGWMCPHPVAGCGIGGCLGVRVPRVGVPGVGVPRMGAWVSGRAGCGPCPAPGAVSKGQRLGMRQLFPEPRGLPEKAPGVYFWALSDSPLAGCWGLCRTCRSHPPPHQEDLLQPPNRRVPLPPRCCRSPRQPHQPHGAGSGSSLGCLQGSCTSPGVAGGEQGAEQCRDQQGVGWARGSLPWAGWWLWDRAGRADPTGKS